MVNVIKQVYHVLIESLRAGILGALKLRERREIQAMRLEQKLLISLIE